MSYSTSLPGLGEAYLDALVTLIQASVTNLNTALSTVSPALSMTWTSGQIVLGDPITLTASRISIVGGGEQDGQDMAIEPYFVPTTAYAGYRDRLSANIYVYIHPDEFQNSDALTQEASRERARSRICDHLRKRVLNDPANTGLTLTSTEHDSGGDALANCYVRQVFKGMVSKMVGKWQEVHCAHLIHTCEIA